MRIHFIVIGLCAVLSAGCDIALARFDCSVTDDRQAALATPGATAIRVIARAGSLEIVGRSDLAEVRASGTACADTQARLDEVELLTRRDGDAVVVETVTEHGRLDLRLEVPHSLPLVVEDTSGLAVITDVAALHLTDGSGSLRIEQVDGDVSVRDGSGSLDIERVDGSVTIEEDGSGSVEIGNVAGDVRIEHDGSGSIDVTDVTGDVLIVEDGSGSIAVTDVGGSFRVSRDGSGAIRANRVRGEVSVP